MTLQQSATSSTTSVASGAKLFPVGEAQDSQSFSQLAPAAATRLLFSLATGPHDTPPTIAPASPRILAKRLLKQNVRLLRRIESALGQLTGIVGIASDEPSRTGTEDVSSGPFVLRIPMETVLMSEQRRRKHRTKQPARRQYTREELCRTLAETGRDILARIASWPSKSPVDTRPLVVSLERYKRTIRRYLRTCIRSDAGYETLFTVLGRLKAEAERDSAKVPLYFLYSQKKRRRGQGADPEEEMRRVARAYVKGLGGKDSIWLRIAPYFQTISAEVERAVSGLWADTIPFQSCVLPGDSRILNMHAINRIAAIAKMEQYCFDTHTSVEQFQEGRTAQKLKALLHQHKCAVESHVSFSSKGHHRPSTFSPNGKSTSAAEPWVYPSLDDMDYLLGIDRNRLEEVMEELKARMGRSDTEKEASEGEKSVDRAEAELCVLNRIVKEKYQKIMLASRRDAPPTAEKSSTSEDDTVRQYFSEVLPQTIKKRHGLILAENRSATKRSLVCEIALPAAGEDARRGKNCGRRIGPECDASGLSDSRSEDVSVRCGNPSSSCEKSVVEGSGSGSSFFCPGSQPVSSSSSNSVSNSEVPIKLGTGEHMQPDEEDSGQIATPQCAENKQSYFN